MNYLESQINDLRADLADSNRTIHTAAERIDEQEVEMGELRQRLDRAEKLILGFSKMIPGGK